MKTILFMYLFLTILVHSNILFSANILLIKNDNNTTSQQLYSDIISFGHNVTTINEEEVTLEILNSYDVTVLACGNNSNPVSSNNLRLHLSSYVISGGKLLIEGGEVAYNSSINPQYNGFKTKALKMKDWISHDGGNLKLNQSYTNSFLATVPNILTQNLIINYNNTTDQDVCENDNFSERFYTCSLFPSNNGVIVYPNVNFPKVIFFTFSYKSATNSTHAKNLLENCLHRLLNIPIGINVINSEIPTRFIVFPNYPNPFNPETKIKFALHEKNKVTIKIYDISGKEIDTITDDILYAGTYEILWKSKNIASGIYFAVITAGYHRGTIKLSLIK